uniref:C2H2-type domain-containing protein n=1 Tax=Scylla olivacea TaxID=85551 RepID=A0A0P4WV76_SCYOL
MKRHEKGKSKESSRNEQFRKYSPHGGNFESEKITYCSRNSPVKVQKCNDELLLLSKEGSKILDKVSSVVQGSEKKDDWITDDEVDDEDHENIEQAFKKEWKEKRLPYNSKEKNFPCEICGKRYSKHSYLRAHIVREHKEHEEAKRYPYSCQHCKKVYVSEKQLLQHQHKHRGPCEICGVVMKCNGLLWAHQRNHDSACKVCNRKFQTKESAYMHMRLKHSENPIPCAECDRTFPFEFIRKRHAKTHHNVEVTRYSCDKCDFWSVGQRALKIHQRRTHGSKLDLFTCKECKCIFNSKVTYKNHVATHVSNSSIVCLSCSAKFISEDELHAHRISVHGVTDKVDTRKETISNYCNSSHVSHYLCALCNITLSDTEDLSQHMYKYHNIDVDSPRVIKPEIEPFLIPEVDENNESTLQTVDIEGTNPQELDRVIKTEPTPVISTDISCSSGRSALLVPASVVPPNVNIVEVNGVQYHVIRESQWQ